MARGGAGGRIRFRAAKSGHASDPHDELARRRNISRFNAVNSGCFYKSRSRICPSRLTDYHCVMWTEPADEEPPTAAAAAAAVTGANATAAVSATLPSEAGSDSPPLCSGDFASDSLLLASCVLAPLLLLLGSCLNCLCGRLMLSYSRRQLPVCLYLALLAGLDTALLWMRFLDLWLQAAFDIKLLLTLVIMDESTCQLLNMLYSTLLHFKAAIQVSLALDTVRLIRQPVSRLERYTSEWVKNSAILAFVLVLLLNGHHLWTLAVVKVSGGAGDTEGAFYCGWTLRWPITEQFAVWIWPIGDLLVGDLLPVTLVAVCFVIGVVGGGLGRRRTGLAYYVIDVELHFALRRGLLACCAGFAALSLPALLRGVSLHATFFAHRLREASPHSISRGAESAAAIPTWPDEEEVKLYIIRLCSGLQLVASPLLLLLTVPRFRCDSLAVAVAGLNALLGCCRLRRGQRRPTERHGCRSQLCSSVREP